MPELNEKLSERELEILRLVATGAANKEIAHQLVISPNTVKVHVRNIFDKIGVSSRTEATLYAVKIGVVRPAAASEISTGNPSSGEQEPGSEDISALPSVSVMENLTETGEVKKVSAILPWLIGVVIFIAVLVIVSLNIPGTRQAGTTPTPLPTVAAAATAQGVIAPRWQEKAAMPSPRKGMGVVEYENAIFMLAGETSQGIDGTVLRYDEDKNGWTVLTSKPTPVTDIQAALIGEKIYVPGGRQADDSATNRLEVFDPRKDAWERKANLPIPLSAYSLATFEGQLYLFGGKNGDQYSASVYTYNPPEDRWTERTAMRSPRAYAGAIQSEGKIYVMGGYDGIHALKLNEAYIPTRDIDESGESPWKTLAPLPDGRYAMGTAQIAGIVFMMGGLDDRNQTPASSIVQYNLRLDQWAEYDKPPVQVGGYLALLASGNFLYILGGETSQGLSAANLTYQAIYTTTVPILLNENTP